MQNSIQTIIQWGARVLESQFLILVISLPLARSPRKFKDKGEKWINGGEYCPSSIRNVWGLSLGKFWICKTWKIDFSAPSLTREKHSMALFYIKMMYSKHKSVTNMTDFSKRYIFFWVVGTTEGNLKKTFISHDRYSRIVVLNPGPKPLTLPITGLSTCIGKEKL